jgi:LPS O-antigen subunit length determinant protein (WzzB/FepE family)
MEPCAIKSTTEEISLFTLLCTLHQFKRWIIGIPLIITMVTAVIVFLQPNQYTTELKISSTENHTLLVKVMNAPQLINQLEQRLKLMAYYHTPTWEKLTDKLAQTVKVAENKEKLLVVRVTDKNPEMAAHIANAYGEIIISIANTEHLTEKGKQLERLERRLLNTRKLLTKNAEEMDTQNVEKTIRQLSSTTRFAVEGMASLQAEAATLSEMEDLSQNDALRLSNIINTINQLIKPNLNKDPIHDEVLYKALVLQQRKVFLTAIERKLLRIIDELKLQIAKDPQILKKASIPVVKSGPARLKIIIALGMVSLFLTIFAVLVLVGFVRMRREYLQSKQLS